MKTDLALTFIDLCDSESDLAVVIDKFHNTIEAYGFSACACGGWAGVGKQRSHRFFFNSWPKDWTDIYNNGRFFQDDPFVQESFRRMVAFTWTELGWDRSLSARGREIDRAARDFGWTEIVGVPAHGPAGYQGFVSIATMGAVEVTSRDRAMLHAIGLAVHHRCRSEAGFGMPELAAPLTPREIECLQWAAVGKTDWDIGQLLGVTASTAHYHIERAKNKLGVNSRVQAVALTVLRGLI